MGLTPYGVVGGWPDGLVIDIRLLRESVKLIY